MMEFLLSVPVIVKVFSALAFILVVNRLCGHLVVAVAGGALLLAVWCGHSAGAMAAIAWGRFASLDNALLMLVLLQVIWLSLQMSEAGIMQDLVSAVQMRLSRRGAMAVLPAMIGLLPMPGGALFSAPLVDECDPGRCVSPKLKTLTNHWFRHIWEYWWPLYPGVLLAIELTRLEIWQFMLVGIPLTIGSIAAGYVFLLRRIEREDELAPGEDGGNVQGLASLMLPILVVIAVYAAVRAGHAVLTRFSGAAVPMNRYVPMALGLLCAVLVLQRRRPLGGQEWKKIIFSGRAWNLAVIVAVVRIYGAFIEANLPDGTPLVAQMRSEMTAAGIPLVAMVMLMPFVSGLATGLAVGFVGASFPIILNLLGQEPSLGAVAAVTVLAYGFGYIGMLVSPVHICLIVGSRYFRTRVLENSVALLKPALVVLVWAVVVHLIFRGLLT